LRVKPCWLEGKQGVEKRQQLLPYPRPFHVRYPLVVEGPHIPSPFANAILLRPRPYYVVHISLGGGGGCERGAARAAPAAAWRTRAATPTQSAGSQRVNETLIPEPGALQPREF
jgi:hypothetical protein